MEFKEAYDSVRGKYCTIQRKLSIFAVWSPECMANQHKKATVIPNELTGATFQMLIQLQVIYRSQFLCPELYIKELP
jgi:hypothetical protein